MNIERDLLVYCLKSMEALRVVLTQQVSADLFLNHDNRKMFASILYAFKHFGGTLMSEEELKSILASSKSMQDPEEQVRFVCLYTALVQSSIPTSSVQFYIQELRKLFKKEKLASSMKAALGLLQSNQVDQALDLIEKNTYKMKSLVRFGSMKGEFYGDKAMDRYQLLLDKKHNPQKFMGVMTGFSQFDKVTKGFRPGQLIVLSGRAKSGKSIFMVNVTCNVLAQGKKVLYVAIEGGLDLPVLRMDSIISGVPYEALQDGSASDADFAKYYQTMKSLQGTKNFYLWQVSPQACTSFLIEQKIQELKAMYGTFDLVVVDHMGLMGTDSTEARREMDWLRLGSISLDLKNVALDNEVPIITPFHVTREAAKKKENYSGDDLGRSQQVVQNVDMVLSWRMSDPEEFKMCGAGTIFLDIPDTRDSKNKLIELVVDFNQMSVQEKPDQIFIGPALNGVQGTP